MQDFSTALQAWKDVHLDAFGENVAEAAKSIAQAQERSIIARQNLAERTREFKRQPVDVQLQHIRVLLKQYQAEIDALMDRAKKSEAIVLQTWNRFRAVPDPYPILEALVDATIHEQDMSQLRAQIVQLQSECSEWENRCVSTEERLRLSSESSTKTMHLVDDAIESTTQQFQRQQERLESELKAAYAHIRELRESHEFMSSRLDSHKETTLDASQVEAWTQDLERARERASKAERQVVQIQEMMERQNAAQIQEMSGRITTLESQLSESRLERTREGQSRVEEMEALRNAMTRQQDTHTLAAQAWEQERFTLLRTLNSQSDYDDIKRDLIAWQTRGMDPPEEPVEPSSEPAVPVDPLLKGNAPEVTKSHDELLQEQARLIEALEAEKLQVHRLTELNSKLESDLSKEEPSSGALVGLLPIVTSQRDRFRSRATELEKQVQSQSHMLQELREQLSQATRNSERHLSSSSIEMPYPGRGVMHVNDHEEATQPGESLRVRVRTCG